MGSMAKITTDDGRRTTDERQRRKPYPAVPVRFRFLVFRFEVACSPGAIVGEAASFGPPFLFNEAFAKAGVLFVVPVPPDIAGDAAV